MAEQSSKDAMTRRLPARAIGSRCRYLRSTTDLNVERFVPCVLVSAFLTLVNLLLELLGLLLVGKRKPSYAVLELEGKEKDSVLVVRKRVVDFLIPDHTSARRLPTVNTSSKVSFERG